MAPKYKERHKGKKYDFAKYTSSDAISEGDENISSNNKKFNPKKVSFKNAKSDEIDPIQSNTSSNYLIDNEDAIVVNLKKNNKN